LSQTALENKAFQFIDSVLALQLRLAVFDCDGTLWSGDSGRDFFYWEFAQGLIEGELAEQMIEHYQLYELGEIDELTMCGEMVTMNRGLAGEKLSSAGKQFFDDIVAARIFPEMLELTRRLAENGCELWAVSSTNSWVVEAGAERFGIPPERVLAASVYTEDGKATDRLIRVPTDELKAVAINEAIGREVDGVFGNSVHDQAMLEIARHPFSINPNPDLEKVAIARGWPIYWPQVSS